MAVLKKVYVEVVLNATYNTIPVFLLRRRRYSRRACPCSHPNSTPKNFASSRKFLEPSLLLALPPRADVPLQTPWSEVCFHIASSVSRGTRGKAIVLHKNWVMTERSTLSYPSRPLYARVGYSCTNVDKLVPVQSWDPRK